MIMQFIKNMPLFLVVVLLSLSCCWGCCGTLYELYVTDENGNITFRTKGDNNSVEDTRLVEPNEVMGRYIGVIPKIGLPVLWIKSGEAVPDGVEN